MRVRNLLTMALYSLTPVIAAAAVDPPIQIAAAGDPAIWENLARTPFILALCFIVWMFLQDRQKRDDAVRQMADSCHAQTAEREKKYDQSISIMSAALQKDAVASEKVANALDNLTRVVGKIETDFSDDRSRRDAREEAEERHRRMG